MLGAAGGAVVDAAGRHPMERLRTWVAEDADRLAACGLRRKEPVLVPVSNRARDIAAMLAVMRAGGVAVPIHRRAHRDMVAATLQATGSRLAVHGSPVIAATTPGAEPVSRIGGAPPPDRPLLEDAAMITFTSGSTGRPKGVVLSGRRMTAKLEAIGDTLAMPAGAASFVPLQLTFSFGQWVAFLTLLRGGTLHLAERFDPAAVGGVLRTTGIDYFAAVPTMLRMLPEAGPGAEDPLLTVLTGGEPVSDALRRRVLERWPQARIASIYGLTETGTCDLFHFDRAGAEPDDSLGRPPPGIDVRTDPANGELLIRTPYGMLGYLDMPEATAAARAGAFLRTGDIARIGPDGRVVLVGRLKEMINRGGNKIAPLEIERLFAVHPDIQSVLATGASDPGVGEAIHLLVIPRPGKVLNADRLRAWASGRIDRFKLPDVIHVGGELPLGRTGKADRGELRRRIEAGEVRHD